jgi:hypothetical protein
LTYNRKSLQVLKGSSESASNMPIQHHLFYQNLPRI